MGIRFENSFAVPAALDDAWKTLIDLPRVVPCMPGTELTEVMEPRRFRAAARVRAGPIELVFQGEGELYDVDDASHTAKLRAKGSDTKGRGAFQTQMDFALAAQGAETLVQVASDLTLTGSVAQHARGAGVVKEMARTLTAQFARNLAAEIAARGAPEESGRAVADGAGDARTHAPAISGIALLVAALKAWLRRLLGARS